MPIILRIYLLVKYSSTYDIIIPLSRVDFEATTVVFSPFHLCDAGNKALENLFLLYLQSPLSPGQDVTIIHTHI